MDPGINIEKWTNNEDADDPTGPLVGEGCLVTWTYIVTNPGNVALTDVEVTDDQGVIPIYQLGDDGNGLLDPSETWIYTAFGIAQSGQYDNLGEVVGTPVDHEGEPLEDFDPVTAKDPSHYFGVAAAIHIEKATNGEDADDPTGPEVHVGDVITWTYLVTNPGNVALDVPDDRITDDNGTPGDPSDDFHPTYLGGDDDGDGLLDTDETWHYEAFGIAQAHQYRNVVNVVGTAVDDRGEPIPCICPVTDEDPSHYLPLSSLSGYVYVDVNDNGIFDPSEKPLENTVVTLSGTDDLGTVGPTTTTTDANGFYIFSDLRPGVYTIQETQPAAYLDGKDTIGTPGGDDTVNDEFSNIVLPAGYDGTENNFGELGLEFPSKTAFIYPWGYWETDYDGSPANGEDDGCGSMSATGGGRTVLMGTDGDDLFEFTAGPTADQWLVKLNGIVQQINPGTESMEFDGLEGNDRVVLRGTDGDETLTLRPGSGLLLGENYTVSVVNVELIVADGLGGNDVAKFYDSPGDDNFIATPDYAELFGDGFVGRVEGFYAVHAYATAGGTDVAKLFDSPGDDTFDARPIEAVLSGTGFYNRAKFFEGVHAYATSGGTDVAKLYDSAGDDHFVADPIAGVLSGSGFYNRAKYFDAVHAYATAGGADVAKLYDSAGDDRFIADPVAGVLSGGGFYNRAKFFDGVHAYGTAGGHDVAELYDSAGNDLLVADERQAALFGADFHNRAKFFEEVQAHASAGGNDEARLSDSAGSDYLEAAANWARLLYAGGRSTWVGDFDLVGADSSHGGTDTKHVEAIDFIMLATGPWTDI